MNDFYVKSGNKYVPVNIQNYFTKDIENNLVIIRIGTDEFPASSSDLEATEKSLTDADILKDLANVSVIITPFQIQIDAIDKNKIGDKNIYLQICSGSEITMLEEQIRKIYNKIKDKFASVILPTPLKIKDYRKVQDILERAEIRKVRRCRARG